MHINVTCLTTSDPDHNRMQSHILVVQKLLLTIMWNLTWHDNNVKSNRTWYCRRF